MVVFISQGYKVVRSQKKYKVADGGPRGVLLFHVMEIASRQILGSYESVKEANDHVRRFNLGKGFDGVTPSFMLDRVPTTFSEPFNE